MRDDYLNAIKRFEGWTETAKWDYAQNSNGYGTKALFAGEVISRAEAEARFAAEIAEAQAAVAKFAPDLDEGTSAALTSLTFNAGPGWMRSGLGASIKAGDLEAAKVAFVKYVNAGNQRLAGLEARRAAEVQWFGKEKSEPEFVVHARAGDWQPNVVVQDPNCQPAESSAADTAISASLAGPGVRSTTTAAAALDDYQARWLFLEALTISLALHRRPPSGNEETTSIVAR